MSAANGTNSSRKGKPIAKQACDCCRIRKTQCAFGPDNPRACLKCLASKIPCTFLQDRKQRGPVSRRLAQFRQGSAASLVQPVDHAASSVAADSGRPAAPPQAISPTPSTPTPTKAEYSPRLEPSTLLPLPLGLVSIEHLVPNHHVFLRIIQDYQDRIYPSLPLVHLPELHRAIEQQAYVTDQACLRLCFALCAVTVASIPRKFGQYSQGAYADIGEMVKRACHLVLTSRLLTEPCWQNDPTPATAVISVLLCMASHYAGMTNAGWGYASEAIYLFRTLKLYKKESYANLEPVDAEICKRAFWSLYIIQIHDRMSFVHPHTGLSYDPLRTDWEFLLDIDDNLGQGATKETTVLAGFLVVVKVFLCVADLLTEVFPGQPAPCVLPLDRLGFDTFSDRFLVDFEPEPSLRSRKLRGFLRVQHRLQMILNNLPSVLRPLSQTTQSPGFQTAEHGCDLNDHSNRFQIEGVLSPSEKPLTEAELRATQFEVMWVNIQVTSLYIQSVFLELCISSLEGEAASGGRSATSPATDMVIDATSGSPGSLYSSSSEGLARQQGSSTSDHTRPTLLQLRAKLQGFRESIARDVLNAVNACSLATLESHGASMITKIREVAATLLDAKATSTTSSPASYHPPPTSSPAAGGTVDNSRCRPNMPASPRSKIASSADNSGCHESNKKAVRSPQEDWHTQEEDKQKRQWYVTHFIEVLAKLDYASQQVSDDSISITHTGGEGYEHGRIPICGFSRMSTKSVVEGDD